MSDTELPLQRLRPLWRSAEVEEGPTSIDVDSDIGVFEEDEIASILESADASPSFFSDFEVTFRAPEVPEHPIIRLSDGLEKNERGFELLGDYLDGENAEVHRWEQVTSELLADGVVDELAAYLFEWSDELPFRFHIDCIVAKSEFGGVLHEEVAPGLPLALSVWSRQEQLEAWLASQRSEYRDVIETLFPDERLPVFLFLDDDSWANEDVLRGYSVSQFLETESDTLEPLVRQYLDWISRDRELVEAGPSLPIISPAVFSSPEYRALFDTVFLYGVFAVVSEQVLRTGDLVEFRITTKRDSISDRFSDNEFSTLAEKYRDEALTDLYDFYDQFIEKGTRETYRKLWHRSITDECESLQTLASCADDVVRTYEFLEEEAIEANFEDLSEAIQDAHTFTADITSTVSERTTGLTSEIQKVVLTLLGAVFANVFLVIRWSNVDMVLPFSIFVIAGILGFYFPTIQTRVNELDDIIQESNADFEVYSNTIQEFSNHLFDFSRFEDRRDSYLQYAQRRKEWTVEKLRTIFTLLTLIWMAFIIVSILGFAAHSRQFIVAVSSLFPALLIIYYHKDLDYYPTNLVPFLEWNPPPMVVLVGGTLLTLLVKFLL